jgi:thiol-disulfide isomerase/thioredoxin
MRSRAVCGAVVLGGVASAAVLALAGGTAVVGKPAPQASAATWVNVAEGEEPTPDRLRGKVVMIEFWGTWCAPCVRAMPRVQELHDRYRDRGLVVLAIS